MFSDRAASGHEGEVDGVAIGGGELLRVAVENVSAISLEVVAEDLRLQLEGEGSEVRPRRRHGIGGRGRP